MTDQPWNFDQARTACRDASSAQAAVEKELRHAYREYAEAEKSYRVALAKRILTAHAGEGDTEGVAWTVAPDIARGDPEVARKRMERDIAEGVKEAMVQAAWRRNADRKDAQRFADWSQRREMAEFHGRDPEPEQDFSPVRQAA